MSSAFKSKFKIFSNVLYQAELEYDNSLTEVIPMMDRYCYGVITDCLRQYKTVKGTIDIRFARINSKDELLNRKLLGGFDCTRESRFQGNTPNNICFCLSDEFLEDYYKRISEYFNVGIDLHKTDDCRITHRYELTITIPDYIPTIIVNFILNMVRRTFSLNQRMFFAIAFDQKFLEATGIKDPFLAMFYHDQFDGWTHGDERLLPYVVFTGYSPRYFRYNPIPKDLLDKENVIFDCIRDNSNTSKYMTRALKSIFTTEDCKSFSNEESTRISNYLRHFRTRNHFVPTTYNIKNAIGLFNLLNQK